MKKRAIVAESPGPAKTVPEHIAGPLEGATFIAGAASASQLPAAAAREVGFAGRSNAGKSSAINALARQTRLAFASRTPGRTREINFFRLRAGAVVADLPGYGYAAVPQAVRESWQEFLWTYVTTRTTLIGLVLVVDSRHGIKPLDADVLGAFLPSGRPVLILATKIDKLNQAQRREAVQRIRTAMHERFSAHARAVTVIGFSAASRQGVDDANATLAGWLAA